MSTKFCFVCTLLVGSIAGLANPAQAQVPELSYTVVKSWSTLYDTGISNPAYGPINSPDGLAWDGSGLWMTECGGTTFAKFDTDGNVVDEFELPGGEMADHLAWDGTYMWANVHSHPDDPGANDPNQSPDGRLIQIDLRSHTIVKTIQIPWADWNMAPMGLGWDGKYLWTNGHMAKQIYRIDPETGEGVETPAFANPVDPRTRRQINTCGNAWDGQSCLWVSDLSAGGYFQVDPATGEIVSFLNPPDNPDPAKYGQFRPAEVRKLFTGMTTDGTDRVWVMDEVEGNPLVYELRVDFPTTGPCAHPVALNESCVPGGQPFCGIDAICAGESGQETCQAAASDEEKPGASDETSSAFGCSALNAQGAGVMGMLSLLLLLNRRSRRLNTTV